MEMTTTNVTLRVLRPADGMWLTRKTVADGEWRLFSKEVYLGSNDTEENWTEVDNAYKEEYEKRLDAEISESKDEKESNS